MRFTIRELALDLALFYLAIIAWLNTDRRAVFEAIQSAVALVFGT